MRNEGDERTFPRRNNNLTSKGRGALFTRKLGGRERGWWIFGKRKEYFLIALFLDLVLLAGENHRRASLEIH